MSRVEVGREYPTEEGRFIDLKIRDEIHKFALIIENKVRAQESRDQLKDYWKDAQKKDPAFAIAGLFLSPGGRNSESAGGFPVVPISYGELTTILEECIAGYEAKGASKSRIAVQYAQALRRWFMEDPELKSLAWRLHTLYPQALEYLRKPEAMR